MSNKSHRKRGDLKGTEKALERIMLRMLPTLLKDKIYKSKKLLAKSKQEKYEENHARYISIRKQKH